MPAPVALEGAAVDGRRLLGHHQAGGGVVLLVTVGERRGGGATALAHERAVEASALGGVGASKERSGSLSTIGLLL